MVSYNGYLFFTGGDYIIHQYDLTTGALVNQSFCVGGSTYIGGVFVYNGSNYFDSNEDGGQNVINMVDVVKTITINATPEEPINPTNVGFYVKPVRSNQTNYALNYDPSSNEITYATGGGGSGIPFIVSPTSQYTTIQSAIDAAYATSPTKDNPRFIWILYGTYTENLTLYPFVNFVGSSEFGVNVIGNTTYTTNTPSINYYLSIENIIFETPSSGDAFTIVGGGNLNVYGTLVFNQCTFNRTNGNCFASTNAHSIVVYQNNCFSNASSGHSIYYLNFTDTNGGTVICNNCKNKNTNTASYLNCPPPPPGI
jgi:hypothetical protein